MNVAAFHQLLRAKDLADVHYEEPLRVEDLAAAAGLSRAHFIREFRDAFGAPPHAYLRDRRLKRAATLLRTTDRLVCDICAAVGWRSVGSFTTSFTRAYGVPPGGTAAALILPYGPCLPMLLSGQPLTERFLDASWPGLPAVRPKFRRGQSPV